MLVATVRHLPDITTKVLCLIANNLNNGKDF